MISPAACQLGMCAHPKIDPTSGEMIVFRYWMDKSYLYWAAVGPDGTVTRPPEVIAEIDRGYLIHDFVITHDFLWCHTHDTNGGDKGGIGERWLSVLQAPRQSGALFRSAFAQFKGDESPWPTLRRRSTTMRRAGGRFRSISTNCRFGQTEPRSRPRR
jgi:hypothetical protein